MADEEGVSLSSEAFAALNEVLGVSGGEGDLESLVAMMQARRGLAHDSDSDNEEEQEQEEFESHAEYYKRLFPERYATETKENTVRVENPSALVTMDDEYVQDLILKAFKKRGHWKISTRVPQPSSGESTDDQEGEWDRTMEPYHFHWGEYEHIEWYSPRFSSGTTLVSCYYNRKGLIRKGNLAYILEKWRVKNPQKTPIAPKSYILTFHDDMGSFEEWFQSGLEKSEFPGFGLVDESERDMRTEDDVWILKPSVTNQANGICLVQSKEQLKQAIERADPMQRAGDFVLQRYLPPLLLDGRKFHLRVFMLLYGSLTAYIAPDFLAIFSLEKYNGATLDETRAHLTNIAHQEVLSEEDEHKCMRLFEETKQDMLDAGLVSTLEEATERVEQVRKRVFEIMAETVEAVSSELTFQTRSNCFELFGLDFLISPDWSVWLLEANAEPDLSKAGDRLQCVIDTVLEDTMKIVIDGNPSFSPPDVVANVENDITMVKIFERAGRAF